MRKNTYSLAKIGADTAENEWKFAENEGLALGLEQRHLPARLVREGPHRVGVGLCLFELLGVG